MRRLISPLLAAVLWLAWPVGAWAATPVDRAAAALRDDAVWVARDNAAGVTASDAEHLRAEIRSSGVPTFVAVFDARAGEPFQLAEDLARAVGRDGVYAVIAGPAGRSFAAGQTSGGTGLEAGVARAAADAAVKAGDGAAGAGLLDDFVARLSRAHADGGALNDGPGAWLWVAAVGALVVVIVLLGLLRHRRGRRIEAAQVAEVRRIAVEDLAALADDVRAFGAAGGDRAAPQDFARALQAHVQAEDAIRLARRPQEFARIAQTLAEGRLALACGRARLEGREPPEQRPPCFFDARHGPSIRDVTWTPRLGAARVVAACEADARRVERGEAPAAREIEAADGERVPFWRAPAHFAPYFGAD